MWHDPDVKKPLDSLAWREHRRGRTLVLGLGLGVPAVCAGAGCVIPLGPTTTGEPVDAMAANDSSTVVTNRDGATGTSIGDASGDGGVPASTGSWKNVTSNLAGTSSECGNLMSLFDKPDEDLVIAGISLHGLWGSRDDGMSWQALGTSDASAMIVNRPTSMVFDPSDKMRLWESGIYNSNGVYVTQNDGMSFQALGTVTHCDLVSVDLTDPNRQTLLVGGHEAAQTLYRSTNGGSSWTNIGGPLPANTNCTLPLVIDSMTHLVGCAGYGGGPTGVWRTVDGGVSWKMMTPNGGASAPLLASDGTIYWASTGSNGLIRSTDKGVTWSEPMGANVITSVHPIELPNGIIASLGMNYVMVSSNKGQTWEPATSQMPITPVGVVYDAYRKAFFIWYFTCGFNGPVPVPNDAIQRFDSIY